MSIASFILGLLSLVGMPLLGSGSVFASVLAVIFGIIGKKKEKNRLYANAGFILGIIALVIIVIGLAAGFFGARYMLRWLKLQ
ncbi:MAG: hypothetical protein ABIK93_01270 [candidate division WOR-3 bacterium]